MLLNICYYTKYSERENEKNKTRINLGEKFDVFLNRELRHGYTRVSRNILSYIVK